MKKKNRCLIYVALVLCLTALLISVYKPLISIGSNDSILKVKIFKVGRADAIVLTNCDECMIIDAGEEEDGYEILEYLGKHGIDHVDKLIITHFDKDHVGGADTLIESIKVDEIILPDYKGSVTDYFDFIQAMEDLSIMPIYLNETVVFSFGDCTVTVEPPSSYDIADGNKEIDNDLSLITTVEHFDNRLVFLGDAEKKRLRDWFANGSAEPCDFVKLPHHGVYNTELETIVERLSPNFVAMCTSSKNPADVQTIQLFKNSGAQVAETRDGDIVVTSDGKNIRMSQN